MVLERFAKKGAAVAGSGAGGFAGGFFNNPGVIVIGIAALGLIFFAGDIRKAFGGFGEAISNLTNLEFPSIELPTINFPQITFPDFPQITFPDFPDFSFLEGFFGITPPPLPTPPPPGVTESPLGPITTPEGCTVDSQGIIRCPTPPTFDVCNEFPELCAAPLPGDPAFIGPTRPFTLAQFAGQTEQQIEETFVETMDQLQLPGGFVGAGPSFEGGTIFETPIANLSLSQIIDRFMVSASKAADILARAGGGSPEGVEQFESFDFGTSTGSGLLPGETQIVTGGATLESEARRAACTSCELFGLNCPICRGEVNFA